MKSTCLAGQDHEDNLKGVFSVVPVVKNLATDVQDHAPVPFDEGTKGTFRLIGGA